MLTLCEVLVAVNVNHTSSSAAAFDEQDGTGTPLILVALMVDPAVTTPHTKVGFTVRDTAPGQLSFAGGGGGVPTQILKLAVDDGVAVHVITLT